MNRITPAELRKKFAELGCTIKIRTTSFKDLARCSAPIITVFRDGHEKPSIYTDGQLEMWRSVVDLIHNLKENYWLEWKGNLFALLIV